MLTILFAILSGIFLFKAGFLTIQHFVILPSSQPLYAYADSTRNSKQSDQTQDNTPVQVSIPDHQINLPIVPSSLVNGEWQVTTQGVSLANSDKISDSSGYVMFGHDWPVLLGRMRQATIGQTITLTFRNGKTKTYKIVTAFNVNPNQVDVLDMAKAHTLLIYTCNGVLDSKRFVVVAQEQ